MSLRSELMEHGLFCIPTEKESIQMPPINVIYLFSLWSGQKKRQANLPEPSCHCQITQSRWGKRLANKWKRSLIFISFCTGGEFWPLCQSLTVRLHNCFFFFFFNLQPSGIVTVRWEELWELVLAFYLCSGAFCFCGLPSAVGNTLNIETSQKWLCPNLTLASRDNLNWIE